MNDTGQESSGHTDLLRRLRARRDIRDHSANNGWRNVEAPAIEIEAAKRIERLEAALRQVRISVGHEDAKKIAADALSER